MALVVVQNNILLSLETAAIAVCTCFTPFPDFTSQTNNLSTQLTQKQFD